MNSFFKNNLAFFLMVFGVNVLPLPTTAQKISYLTTQQNQDSSYYDLLKVGPNEFWAGGENGILTIIDSSGNHNGFDQKIGPHHILKMIKNDSLAFIFTDDAAVFSYNFSTRELQKHIYKHFKKKCFYDAMWLDNGKILICGGATGIARHQKVIPNGFIAVTDANLHEPNIIWRSKRKFVWHLAKNHRHEIFASVYNGINSCIMTTKDLSEWKTVAKKNGLIHEIQIWDSTLFYSGCRSMRYKKTGIAGTGKKDDDNEINGGCIWSLKKDEDNIICTNQHGDAIFINTQNQQKRIFPIIEKAIYDIEIISKGKYMLIGHGQTIAILNRN